MRADPVGMNQESIRCGLNNGTGNAGDDNLIFHAVRMGDRIALVHRTPLAEPAVPFGAFPVGGRRHGVPEATGQR